MTSFPQTLPGIALYLAPPAAALAVSAAARLALRRPAAWPACAAAAACLGWALLAAPPSRWLHPRLVVEHLPGAALAIAVGALAAGSARLKGRAATMVAFLAAASAAAWLAGAPAARPEFWRVVFGVLGLAWLFRRLGAGDWRPASALSLTLAVGLAAADAPAGVVAAALVLMGAVLGLSGPVPAAALAVAVAAPLLAAGRVLEGRLGMVDFVCLGAVAAAALRDSAGRALQARLGRTAAELAAPCLLAALATAAAWIAARAARG